MQTVDRRIEYSVIPESSYHPDLLLEVGYNLLYYEWIDLRHLARDENSVRCCNCTSRHQYLHIPSIILGTRIYKDYKKKISFKSTYAIVNAKNGMAVWPLNAGIDDGNDIIVYSSHNWECITWQLIQLEDSNFLLKNLYTQKTFQPSTPQAGAGHCQQTMGGIRLQYWEFLKQADEVYLIRLKNTNLYMTASSCEAQYTA